MRQAIITSKEGSQYLVYETVYNAGRVEMVDRARGSLLPDGCSFEVFVSFEEAVMHVVREYSDTY